VELPAVAVRELKAWRLRCPKGQLDLCFPNLGGGPGDDRNLRSRVFYPALRRAPRQPQHHALDLRGLRRIRVHDLRHTAASFFIATGADLAAVSRQLGARRERNLVPSAGKIGLETPEAAEVAVPFLMDG
jgi:integrase